jgi:predicted ATPase
MTPKRYQDQAWLHQLEALGAREPILFICEDLHWIDPSSRELLDRMIEREPARIARHDPPRPEFVPPWAGSRR